jgi:hypothetical protein
MFRLLLLQVWTQLLPGAGGEIQTPPIQAKVQYELSISGVVSSNLIGKQFDAISMGNSGSFQTPHTFISMNPLLGEPDSKDTFQHIYTWRINGDELQGSPITIRAGIIEGLSASPAYSGTFSPDAWAKGMVGNFEVKLSPLARIVEKDPSIVSPQRGTPFWYALGFFLILFPTLVFLMRRPPKLSEHGKLSKKVTEAADALEASAKKRPLLHLDNIIRDARQTAQELMRAGEHADEFAAKLDLQKIEREQQDLIQRAEKATDEEAKRTWQEAAQEKGKARASIEEAKKLSERTKARLLRLSASLESTRISIEAPSQHQKTDDAVLTSLQEELRLANEALKDADKLS